MYKEGSFLNDLLVFEIGMRFLVLANQMLTRCCWWVFYNSIFTNTRRKTSDDGVECRFVKERHGKSFPPCFRKNSVNSGLVPSICPSLQHISEIHNKCTKWWWCNICPAFFIFFYYYSYRHPHQTLFVIQDFHPWQV